MTNQKCGDVPFLTSVRSKLCQRSLAVVAGLMFQGLVGAAEPRQWLNLEGNSITAELVKDAGAQVEVKDGQGRLMKWSRSLLSFADQDYLASLQPPAAPDSSKPLLNAPAKIPVPAKAVKFDDKSIRKDLGRVQLGKVTMNLCETPHFLIMHSANIDPRDTAELAERLWHDHAYFHKEFAPLFKDVRYTLLLANQEPDHEELVHWYMETRGIKEPEDVKAWIDAWSRGNSRPLSMPDGLREAHRVRKECFLIKVEVPETSSRPNKTGGVWNSYHTHVLAQNFLQLLAGWSDTGSSQGTFPLFKGHGLYKEISLTGKSGTFMVQLDTGKKESSGSGYADGKNWATQLKRAIRSGDVKPNLVVLFASSTNDAAASDLALAYSFSRFLQSSQLRLAGLGKLLAAVRSSKAIPDPDGAAPFLGYPDGAAMEKAWVDWMASSSFQ